MLKIKKQIKNPDGTITEIEGTEDEVESFERKMEKKRQSEAKIKERKLLLEQRRQAKQAAAAAEESKKKLEALTRPVSELTKQELLDLIQRLISARSETHHYHHWYYNNGWWWKPTWELGRWTYTATQLNPNTNTDSSTYITCNSVQELSQNCGVDTASVYTSMVSDGGLQPLSWTGEVKSNWVDVGSTNGGLRLGQDDTKYGTFCISPSGLTSNMTVKN